MHIDRNHVDEFYGRHHHNRRQLYEVNLSKFKINCHSAPINIYYAYWFYRFAAARSPLHQSGMRFKTIAVHYQGDTSPYMMGGRVSPHHQERFDGNGRVRHPGGIYSDWKPAYWVDDHAMERFFAIHQGIVTVKEHGLYYIYAQVRIHK